MFGAVAALASYVPGRRATQVDPMDRSSRSGNNFGVSKPLAFCLLLFFVWGCGRENPDLRTTDWEANFDRARQASGAGQHDQAIAIAEAFLKDHPDNVDAHLMVGDAYREAARSVSDARRRDRFANAATHYARALALTGNPAWRLEATVKLRDLHAPDGLNDPQEQIRYSRMLIANDPTNINTYSSLVTVFKSNKRYDEAMALLAEAKRAMTPTVDALSSYAYSASELAVAEGFPREAARSVLADTLTMIDDALTKQGRIEKLLYNKVTLLQAQADLETDPARERALSDAWVEIQREIDRVSR